MVSGAHSDLMNSGNPAAMSGVALSDLSARGSLVLLGDDRTRFLQGQTTQDISNLGDWHGAFTTFVTNKGRMISDGFVFILPNEILLDVETNTQQSPIERFDHHIVADDVEVVDANVHYKHFAFFGPKALDLIVAFDARVSSFDFTKPNSIFKLETENIGEIYLSNPARGLGPEIDAYIPTGSEIAFKKAIEKSSETNEIGPIYHLSKEDLDHWRIQCGIPKYGVDLTEKNLPPEGGLDLTGISYQKGCYIGQEVLNRLRAMGSITKKIVGVRFHEPLPSMHEDIQVLFDGKLVGQVTSVAKAKNSNSFFGLAMVKKDHWDVGQLLDWKMERTSKTGKLTIAKTPFSDEGSN